MKDALKNPDGRKDRPRKSGQTTNHFKNPCPGFFRKRVPAPVRWRGPWCVRGSRCTPRRAWSTADAPRRRFRRSVHAARNPWRKRGHRRFRFQPLGNCPVGRESIFVSFFRLKGCNPRIRFALIPTDPYSIGGVRQQLNRRTDLPSHLDLI